MISASASRSTSSSSGRRRTCRRGRTNVSNGQRARVWDDNDPMRVLHDHPHPLLKLKISIGHEHRPAVLEVDALVIVFLAGSFGNASPAQT